MCPFEEDLTIYKESTHWREAKMLRAQWEEIRSTSCKKLRETDKWRLSMRDKHVPNNNKYVHKWWREYMHICIYAYKIDICQLSPTKSFEELKKNSDYWVKLGLGCLSVIGIVGSILSQIFKLKANTKWNWGPRPSQPTMLPMFNSQLQWTVPTSTSASTAVLQWSFSTSPHSFSLQPLLVYPSDSSISVSSF